VNKFVGGSIPLNESNFGNTCILILSLFGERKERRVFEIMKIRMPITPKPLLSYSGLKLQKRNTNLCEAEGARDIVSKVPKLSVSNKGEVPE
jgi:hypothetical protein